MASFCECVKRMHSVFIPSLVPLSLSLLSRRVFSCAATFSGDSMLQLRRLLSTAYSGCPARAVRCKRRSMGSWHLLRVNKHTNLAGRITGDFYIRIIPMRKQAPCISSQAKRLLAQISLLAVLHPHATDTVEMNSAHIRPSTGNQ